MEDDWYVSTNMVKPGVGDTPEDEAAKVKKTLGIGMSVEDTVVKLKKNNYQYASSGDTRRLIEEIDRLNSECESLSAMLIRS